MKVTSQMKPVIITIGCLLEICDHSENTEINMLVFLNCVNIEGYLCLSKPAIGINLCLQTWCEGEVKKPWLC